MKRTTPLAIALLAAAGLAACGGGDNAQTSSADKTVDIVMKDIAFAPAAVEVTEGETVRFLFKNEGKLAHDAFIGDEDEQTEHEASMQDDDAGSEHGGGHGGGGISVEPGESGELTHTFDDAGSVLIGCHEPGHYDAGMVIKVTVAAAP